MSKILLMSLVTWFSLNSYAADSNAISFNSTQSEKMFDAINGLSGTELLENSIGTTTLKNGELVCSLYGSHAGSRFANNPVYNCILNLK